MAVNDVTLREDDVDGDKSNEKNLSTSIYDAIKEKIINGELKPGSILMERKLAGDFGVSRTPVREAIGRLAQDRWVIWRERKRTIVSEITQDDVFELFTLRDMIEPYAIRKIITEGQPQLMAGILAAKIDEMLPVMDNEIEFMKHDIAFHTAIVDALGINKLKPLWQKISEDMMRLNVQAVGQARPSKDIIAEHRTIMDAFWNKDLEKALSCMKMHTGMILKIYNMKHCPADVAGKRKHREIKITL